MEITKSIKPGDQIDVILNIPMKIMMLPDANEGYIPMKIGDTIADIIVDEVPIAEVGGTFGGNTFVSYGDGTIISFNALDIFKAVTTACENIGILPNDWDSKVIEKKKEKSNA